MADFVVGLALCDEVEDTALRVGQVLEAGASEGSASHAAFILSVIRWYVLPDGQDDSPRCLHEVAYPGIGTIASLGSPGH